MILDNVLARIQGGWDWFFSKKPRENHSRNELEEFLHSMRVTAKCRFTASVRLNRLGKYSFYTTVILSLGLIFIPLYKHFNIPVVYSDEVLDLNQLFLAISVLVFSIVNSMANYDLRAAQLDDCGVKIKELTRKVRTQVKRTEVDLIELDKYQELYNLIHKESENHKRVDFLIATLESNLYNITGIMWLIRAVVILLLYIFPYIIPSLMIVYELLFILDIMSVTNVFGEVYPVSTIN